MYDAEKILEASLKVMIEFEPDMDLSPYASLFYGATLDALDSKQLAWPGHGVAPDVSFQFVEDERMKPDEYDEFFTDMTGFMMRKFWPRAYGALKGFEKLPPLSNLYTHSAFALGSGAFASPDVQEAFAALHRVGQVSAENASFSTRYTDEARKAGFPTQFGGQVLAPFDRLSDYFRGTKGAMIDMYRRPSQVIKACERILPIAIGQAVAAAKSSGNPRIFIPLHKGLDGFMSEEQFKKFYWPTLRELMIELINEGLIPCPLWEGVCTSRLEMIKDIPPGKACYAFEGTDLFLAKQILGDTVCIRGNVPLSLLATGSPDDIRAYCKKLIDVVGREGGFIMDASTVLDDAKPENVKAMFEFTKEYGRY
ncbi:MAG: uroporphyrinogen decarboxylase family protein [Syntrophorhabdales bacterium]